MCADAFKADICTSGTQIWIGLRPCARNLARWTLNLSVEGLATDVEIMDMVCTVKRQLFESPLGAITVHLTASRIWIVQSNHIVRSPDGE